MTAIQADLPWSIRMLETLIVRRPLLTAKWHYEAGVAALALQRAFLRTQDRRYFDFIKQNIDQFVQPDGSIRTYDVKTYNLDQINEGRALFLLHRETGDARYKNAAFLLRDQLRTQPRTAEGGFWHKAAYPHQMWLDGVYMASPFLAEFANVFAEPQLHDEVVRQISLIERHTRDPRTGLLYHAWDESKTQKWANPQTGCSPNFWGRAVGWFAMALVDVLDHLPHNHGGRRAVIDILRRTAEAIAAVQDSASGLWYQVLDCGTSPGNYLEASASCMFVYALAKGVREGWLAARHRETAQRGYAGILRHLIEVDGQGFVNLHQICSVAGLGYKPVEAPAPGEKAVQETPAYRDGSFAYYVGEKIVSNDLKGTGPFALASLEVEQVETTKR